MSTILETPQSPPVETPATPASVPPGDDWRSSLPEEFKADPSLASFKDVPSLAKSYIETKKLVGQKQGIKVPDDKSTPEERSAFHKALGVPDTPDGYQIKRPEIALTVGWNEQYEGEFKALMHKHGVTPQAAQAIVDMHGQRIAAERQAVINHRQAAMGQLRTEWGSEYEARVGWANRALQTFGGDELVDLLANPSQVPLGDHPLVVKTFSNIAKELIEHGALAATGSETLTADEAEAQIVEKRAALAKLRESSPQAKQLVDEILALTARAAKR